MNAPASVAITGVVEALELLDCTALELEAGALEELNAITELLLDSATLEEDAIALDDDSSL